MTKKQKRNLNYKNLCSKLENNLFLIYYLSFNSDNILKNNKIK